MTSSAMKAHARQVWNGLQNLVVALALLFALANLLGFRLDDAVPSSRFARIEQSVGSLKLVDDTLHATDAGLASELKGLRGDFRVFVRLQCLATTRRDADIAGACDGMRIKDEKRP